MKKLLLLSLLVLFGCSKDDIENNKDEIQNLTSQISNLKSLVNSLNSNIEANNSTIQNLSSKLNQAESLIVSLQNTLSNIELEIETNEEVIDYLNDYINEITNSISSINTSNDSSLYSLELIISELELIKIDVENFSDYNKPLENITLLGHLKAKKILNGVDRFHFGNESTPGTIQLNCDWINLITDISFNNVSGYHPYNNTLLLTHGSMILNSKLVEIDNDNLEFFKNLYGYSKNILVVAERNEDEISEFLNHLKSLNNSVTYRQVSTDSSYSTDEVPELSSSNISNYQAIFYDTNKRPSEEIINNLKSIQSNPLVTSTFVGMGWVWVSYRSEYEGELYPLNNIFSNTGAQFIDWNGVSTSNDTNNQMNYYPESYSDEFICSN